MATMDYNNRTIWGIHGGRTGDADSIFLKKNQMIMGWLEMRVLNALALNRDASKTKVQEILPDKKSGYYPVATGQIFRFVHEVKESDLAELILNHYDQFDSKYKGMLPLKRVYVPEPLEED